MGHGHTEMVKVTLTDWIKDEPEGIPTVTVPLSTRDSEADLAAAIEASKLTAPGLYWNAKVLDDM